MKNADKNPEADKSPLAQLAHLIRSNQEGIWLRLANETDIQRVSGEVEPGRIKQSLFNWNLVAIDLEIPEGQVPDDGVTRDITRVTQLYLLGFDSELYPWCTSKVMRFDANSKTVLTGSGSFYRLDGPRATGDLEHRLVDHLVKVFISWGLGEHFGLLPKGSLQ